ncbi:ferredoxin family protein [bacterium]|nr:ferredoxin family protein [bacterium]
MAKIHGHVKIEIENCKGCELCVNECPQDSLKMSKNINKKGYHYAVLNDDTCTGCTNCALVCPEAIITVYRESKISKEKMATITDIKDNISISVN